MLSDTKKNKAERQKDLSVIVHDKALKGLGEQITRKLLDKLMETHQSYLQRRVAKGSKFTAAFVFREKKCSNWNLF